MQNDPRDTTVSQVREPSLIAKQISHAKEVKHILGIIGVCFILLLAIHKWPNFAPVAYIFFLNLALIGLVAVATHSIRNGNVNEDYAWIVAGIGILLVTVFFTVMIEVSQDKGVFSKIISLTMTLVWAPIASAMIVGPLMKVKPKT